MLNQMTIKPEQVVYISSVATRLGYLTNKRQIPIYLLNPLRHAARATSPVYRGGFYGSLQSASRGGKSPLALQATASGTRIGWREGFESTYFANTQISTQDETER